MWWDHIVLATFTTENWLANFRMSQSIFVYLCNALHDEIHENDTPMRKTIPIQYRVALTLWYLYSTNADFRTTEHLFGISIVWHLICLASQ